MTWRKVLAGLHRDDERDLQAERCQVSGGVEWVVTRRSGTDWVTTVPTLRAAKAATAQVSVPLPELPESRR